MARLPDNMVNASAEIFLPKCGLAALLNVFKCHMPTNPSQSNPIYNYYSLICTMLSHLFTL